MRSRRALHWVSKWLIMMMIASFIVLPAGGYEVRAAEGQTVTEDTYGDGGLFSQMSIISEEDSIYWGYNAALYFTDISETDVTLRWDQAWVTNEDEIYYKVYLNGVLGPQYFLDPFKTVTPSEPNSTLTIEVYAYTLDDSKTYETLISEPLTLTVTLGDNSEVEFADSRLEDAVREELLYSNVIQQGATITRADMSQLRSLSLYGSQGQPITQLDGLEYAVNLRDMFLSDQNISDLSPIAGLTKLRELDLRYNNISDLSPIAGLTKLQELDLRYNNISDLSPIAELTQLESLLLWDNEIESIQALSGMTSLKELDLDDNNITDISPLKDAFLNGSFQMNHEFFEEMQPTIWLNGNPLDLTLGSSSRAAYDFLVLNYVRVHMDTVISDSSEEAAVRLGSSATGSVAADDEFTVTLYAKGIEDLYGFVADLSYDDSLLEVVSAEAASDFGNLAGGDGYNFRSYPEDITTASGNIRVSAVYKGLPVGLDASQNEAALIDIVFKAKTDFDVTTIWLDTMGTAFSDYYGIQYLPDNGIVEIDIQGSHYNWIIGLYMNYNNGDFVYFGEDTEEMINLYTDLNNEVVELNVGIQHDGQPTNPTIVWTSSNPDVAEVNGEYMFGYVQLYQEGSTIITASAENGQVTTSIVLYVLDEQVASFTLDSPQGIVGIGEHLAVDVSTDMMNLLEFETVFEVLDYPTYLVGVTPSEQLAPVLDGELEVELLGSGRVLIKGKLLPDTVLTGNTLDLYRVYLMPEVYEQNESKEISNRQVAYLVEGALIDHSGIAYLSDPYDEDHIGHVPAASADVDGYVGVGITDLVRVAQNFNATNVPGYDFDHDGTVGIEDIAFVHARVLVPDFDPFHPPEGYIIIEDEYDYGE